MEKIGLTVKAAKHFTKIESGGTSGFDLHKKMLCHLRNLFSEERLLNILRFAF